MTIEDLKEWCPELYAAAVQVGIDQERAKYQKASLEMKNQREEIPDETDKY